MQPEELHGIRKALGWTLKRMADEIGMSETYVGQMERGQKPIEKRTGLAVRYLAIVGAADVAQVPRETLGWQAD